MSTAAEAQLSVLVVDDEEPIRQLLSWNLEDSGYYVRAASCGNEALTFLRNQEPVDIVVSDINMPGMDGVVLSQTIEVEFPHVPVLLISGRPGATHENFSLLTCYVRSNWSM